MDYLDWEGLALHDLMDAAVHHHLTAEAIREIVQRAEQITRDFDKQQSVPQVAMSVAMTEHVEGVTIHNAIHECDRCGEGVRVSQLEGVNADGISWLVCPSCADDLARAHGQPVI